MVWATRYGSNSAQPRMRGSNLSIAVQAAAVCWLSPSSWNRCCYYTSRVHLTVQARFGAGASKKGLKRYLVGVLCYKNLTEALQLLLGRSLEKIKAANQTPGQEQDEPNKPVIMMEEWRRAEPAHVQKARRARRSGRYARYQQVVELHEQGMKPMEIARHLLMGERTVHRWLASDTFPEARKRRRQNAFEPFAPYVLSQRLAGERNGLALWREIKAQGYTGSARRVSPYLETLKQVEVKPAANPQRILKYTPNAAVWLFVRDPKDLEKVEQEALAALCQASAQLRSASGLVQDFFSMVHKRQGHRLDAWLERVASSDLPELQSFANGVERDKAAVQAGLTWWITKGVVEGSVTKIKLIKRQRYGRASFALLRQRVLHAFSLVFPSASPRGSHALKGLALIIPLNSLVHIAFFNQYYRRRKTEGKSAHVGLPAGCTKSVPEPRNA